MIFTIEPSSPIPIYRQLVDQVIYRIAAEELCDGDQLPSIRSLATELRINPNTVIKSYKELEHLGFATSRHGKGYFITDEGTKPLLDRWRRDALEKLRLSASRALSVGIRLEEIRRIVEEVLVKGGSHD